jgi:16S rRNA processing protein RimM
LTNASIPPNLLEVGRIGKPHGVRGDFFVSFTTDVEERHQVGSVLMVQRGDQLVSYTISTSRPQQDRFVVHFEGVDDRTGAEQLTNKVLYAEPLEDPDALWVHELIGSQVVDTKGADWGKCTGVINNPAHLILELSTGVLVPIPFVVSSTNGVTTINPPEGLAELLES